jgi:hypothetical protein
MQNVPSREEQIAFNYDQHGRPIPARRSKTTAPHLNQPQIPMDVEEEDEQFYNQRPHTSIRRYDRPAVPAQQRPRIHAHPQQHITVSPATQAPRQQRQPHPNQNKATPPDVIYGQAARPQRRFHWLLFVGIGMIVTTAFCIGILAFYSWFPVQQDDWTYGRPRTYQTDAVVGQDDSKAHPTHFIVINLNRHILIIEIKGGDPAHSSMFVGPTLYGQGGDLAPVTLTFADVNNNGHPEMIVLFQGNQIIFLNEQINGQWQFVPKPTQ